MSITDDFLLMTRRHARSRKLRRIPFFRNCMESVGRVRLFEHLHMLTMKEQIGIVSSARGLLGPHGAGLTHVIFLPRGSPLIEVSDYVALGRSVAHIYRNLAHFTDHAYRAVPTLTTSCTLIRDVLRPALVA